MFLSQAMDRCKLLAVAMKKHLQNMADSMENKGKTITPSMYPLQ
jgi:hypothetical protein